MRFRREWVAFGLAIFLVACDSKTPTAPSPVPAVAGNASSSQTTSAPASAPAPATAPATAPVASPATRTISGTVWIHGTTGVLPARDGSLEAWVETALQEKGIDLRIAADGRFTTEIPGNTLRVRLMASPQSDDALQPCAVTLDVAAGILSTDVDLVRSPDYGGVNLPASFRSRSPTLSGVVYEQTPQGRRPIPGAWVILDADSGGLGLKFAWTGTDAEGRYLLCAVPPLPWLAAMAGAPGFDYAGSSINNQTTLDIELKRKP